MSLNVMFSLCYKVRNSMDNKYEKLFKEIKQRQTKEFVAGAVKMIFIIAAVLIIRYFYLMWEYSIFWSMK